MSNKLIGRILATEKNPTTIDNFAFWTKSNLILNPFDIVKVEHIDGSYTYGTIEDISHITDAASFLSGFISSDFGEVEVEAPTIRVGMNFVQAKVICNDKYIYIPVQNNAKVYLATADEINYALGLKNIQNPLCCGYLNMYKGTGEENEITLPVNLNADFLIGPEGAHLNISGISGLAAKTSYSMFLLKAIQDMFINNNNDDESVAIVMFNVKGKDLLGIDQPNDFSKEHNPEKAKEETAQLYKDMGLSPEPFKNVTYYFPYSDKNHHNTYLPEDDLNDLIETDRAKLFEYIYEEDSKSLDLMFSDIDDTTQTMDAIINCIITKQGEFENVKDWDSLLSTVRFKMNATGKDAAGKEIPVVSWRKFYRIISKAISDRDGIFRSRVIPENKETRLGDAITKIKKNDVYVVDIAKMSEDKQAFIFGDCLRTIYDLQLGEYSVDPSVNPPKKIIVFIDELNKYASKDSPKTSPILRSILDVAERGRSLGIVLFAAEQFRSAIHERVTGNCSTHAYGRTNSIEVSKADYKSIPNVYKNMMTRLEQGEYIIQNPVFRSLLHIRFPKPIYKQFKS